MILSQACSALRLRRPLCRSLFGCVVMCLQELQSRWCRNSSTRYGLCFITKTCFLLTKETLCPSLPFAYCLFSTLFSCMSLCYQDGLLEAACSAFLLLHGDVCKEFIFRQFFNNIIESIANHLASSSCYQNVMLCPP